VAKVKKITVDLDALISKDKVSVVSEDEVVKLRDAKFAGGVKRLPSLTARTIFEALMKTPNEGRAISTKDLTDEQKHGVIRTMKKELMRCARAAKKDDLRVLARDQGDRVSFMFDKRKEGSGKKKTKTPKK
jgi:hypothetical protein